MEGPIEDADVGVAGDDGGPVPLDGHGPDDEAFVAGLLEIGCQVERCGERQVAGSAGEDHPVLRDTVDVGDVTPEQAAQPAPELLADRHRRPGVAADEDRRCRRLVVRAKRSVRDGPAGTR